MTRLIESIRIYNGSAELLVRHQQRVESAYLHIFDSKSPLALDKIIARNPPPISGLYKLRVEYDEKTFEMEYIPYSTPQFHSYRLAIIPSDFDYRFKYADRALFDLITGETEPGILPILIKDELITDSTFTNLIFRKGDSLFTPITPLLKGVQISRLIDNGSVKPIIITQSDITLFDEIIPVNAMNPPGSIPGITTKK